MHCHVQFHALKNNDNCSLGLFAAILLLLFFPFVFVPKTKAAYFHSTTAEHRRWLLRLSWNTNRCTVYHFDCFGNVENVPIGIDVYSVH